MTATGRSTEKARRRWFRAGLAAATLAAAGWVGGLLWFVAQVPRHPQLSTRHTDAVVVLTGGSERLETGLRLLAEGYAGQLFISGVGHGVDVAALLRVAGRGPEDLACCISIGYTADNTAGNARETAAWMRAKGYRSLRLVTASYHMPRSLMEFRRAMPDIEIVPHPVFPPQFKRDRWWQWPGTAMLMVSEYQKYLLMRFLPPETLPGDDGADMRAASTHAPAADTKR